MYLSAERIFSMTPSGGNPATPPVGVPFARRLYCSVSGTVIITNSHGDTVTYQGVAGFYIHAATVSVGAASTATVVGEY